MKRQTQGQKKLRIQFERLVETESFKTEVERVRRILNLPRNANLIGTKEFEAEYEREVRALEKKAPASNKRLSRALRDHILYNKLSFDDLGDVCEIIGASSELEQYFLNENPDSRIQKPTDFNDEVAYFLKRYPVSVRIHIGASQNDVVDFIKKNWQEINDSQKFFAEGKRSPLKSSKTRTNKKERDKFIYEHRNMPRKALAKLVRETFKGETLDNNDVGKIISIEEKRRKM